MIRIKNIVSKKFQRLFFLFLTLLMLSLFSPISTACSEIPKRIVSLAPNVTEILFTLGIGDRIIGVTNFCDYPEDARKKTKVGGMSNPSLEAVVSLKPDIVIMTKDGNPKEFADRLRSLNIRIYVFNARRLSELPQAIRDLGAALGAKERADILTAEIETAFNKLRVRNQKSNSPLPYFIKGGHEGINDSALKKKALFIIWPEPLIVAGPGTIADDAIILLGLENIASRAKVSYPKYSLEEIFYQSPDIIFIGKGHTNMKEASEGLLEKLANVPAVNKGNVFYLSDMLYRLGPRVLDGIEEMARCLE